jgi:serine/threonine-protein kinase
MGVVYRAFDTKLERTVALKFLPDHLLYNDDEKKRVLREARTAATLDHPNIGVIHGFEESEDGHVFIVMAYYEGDTLAARLHKGPLPVGDAVDIAMQMAQALASAHASAVIHRDIKPSNVMLTKQGLIKIVDFGLARISSSAGSTQSISTGGTVGYMAPEQALGKMTDQRTDIWSLGVTVAEMVTARNPFMRDSAGATVLAIVNEGPQPMDEVPPDLLRIIYHALAKEPEMRYQTCEEMLSDLRDFRREVDQASSPKTSRTASVASKELKLHMQQASRPSLRFRVEPERHWGRWLLVLVGILAIAVVLWFVPPVHDRVMQMAGDQEDHIAVLPFENSSSDASMQAVADGLMDSMTDELSNLSSVQKSLWVVPASVVRSHKITDPMMAAKELGATLVVRGSIQRQDQAVHLSVVLIDAKHLRQIGATQLEDNAGDIASLQAEAVSRLARLMNIKVSAETLKATGGSVAPAAYESYLKALGFLQRYDKPGNVDQAIAALQTAVETDPRFAVGYAELGEAFRLKNRLDQNLKWVQEAEANCRKAVEIDDRLPAAYVTLARIHQVNGHADLALQEFQQALKLNPRSAEAMNGMAKMYEDTGHLKEAEDAYIKSAALKPDYWDGYDELGLFYDRHAKYAEAVQALKRAADLTPDNAQVFSNLGAVYIDWGDNKVLPDAEQALKKSIALGPTYEAYANLASLYYGQQRYGEAAANFEAALKLVDHDYQVWIFLTNTYEWLHEDAKAQAASQRAMALLEPLVKMKPQDANAQAELAAIYAKEHDREKAMVRIQAALALAPDDASVLDDVGIAYEHLGDRKQALQYVQKSLQKGNTLANVKSDPDLQELVRDPNFHPQVK